MTRSLPSSSSHSKRLASSQSHASASDSIPHPHNHKHIYYEGERLDGLLQSLQREIESARLVDGKDKALPLKIWLKFRVILAKQQHFAIGVNHVTRALERMSPQLEPNSHSLHLQAVLVASDCNPKWLTKHLLSLALSRNVPVIFLKHSNKNTSLRLAQLFKLNSAIAVGVKGKGNSINQLFSEILRDDLHDAPYDTYVAEA